MTDVSTNAVGAPLPDAVISSACSLRTSVRATERFDGLQILRFVAAASVLIGHVMMNAKAFGFIDNHNYAQFDRFPWGAGVDIFFILSGFIICHSIARLESSGGTLKTFALKRFVRVVPIYWIYTLAAFALLLVFPNKAAREGFSVGHVVSSFMFFAWPTSTGGIPRPILGQGWTLHFEMIFYALAALAICINKNKRTVALVGLIVATYLPFLVLRWLYPQSTVAQFYAQSVMLEFCFGIGLYKIYISGVRLAPVMRYGLVFVSIPALYWLNDARFDAYPRLLLIGFPCALITASFTLAGPREGRDGPLWSGLILLGSASFSLYLCHTFVIHAYGLVARYFAIDSLAVYVVSATLGSVVAAVLSYIYLEQNVIALFRRRFGI